MPFRKREAKPVVDLDTAKGELERAREALAYWKQQQHLCLEELDSMNGIGGWIAKLTGSHAASVEEAMKKLEVCKRKLVAEGKAQQKAREVLDALENQRDLSKLEADERLLDLELVAERLRSLATPEADALSDLEDQLDGVAAELIAYQEVVVAAGALNAALGSLNRSAIKAQSRVLGVLTSSMESIALYDKIPGALKRFHDACIAADIPPLDLRVPGLDIGRLMRDPMFLATREMGSSIEDLRQTIIDERDTITDIQLQVAGVRKKTLERQQALHAERHALLEAADT